MHYLVIFKDGQYYLAASKQDAVFNADNKGIINRLTDIELEEFIQTQIS